MKMHYNLNLMFNSFNFNLTIFPFLMKERKNFVRFLSFFGVRNNVEGATVKKVAKLWNSQNYHFPLFFFVQETPENVLTISQSIYFFRDQFYDNILTHTITFTRTHTQTLPHTLPHLCQRRRQQ